ncbi:MAG: hypothetical protein FWF92_10400 [Oscillospiraceae bacterium]|nr:hypothetical protein [Oscillospiraceae bacterium]
MQNYATENKKTNKINLKEQKTMKKSSVVKILTASLLAIIICLSAIIPVFAANPVSQGTGSDDPAGAAISKHLKVPVGTKIPDGGMTFTFDIKLTAVDEIDVEQITAGDKPIKNSNPIVAYTIDITYSASDFDGLKKTYKDYIADGNTYTFINESSDIFAGVTFPHEGLYEFEITEKEKTYTIADANHETVTYSGAKYLVTAYVMKDDDTGLLFIKFVSAVVIIPDNEEQKVDEKVDPTPNAPDGKGHSDMIFTNTYVRTNGTGDGDEEPEDTSDATLSISKTVTGDFGNKSLHFDFTLTITVPELVTEPKEAYIAYIVEEDENGDYALIVYTESGDPVTIEFENETPNTFQLKHGQKLVFVDTPVGTTYDVNETGSKNYKPSVAVIYDSGTAVVTDSISLETDLTGKDLGVTDELVGEDTNSADFTNENDTTTPTGLDLNDLPFIGMIVIAIIGISIYIIFKTRKKNSMQ